MSSKITKDLPRLIQELPECIGIIPLTLHIIPLDKVSYEFPLMNKKMCSLKSEIDKKEYQKYWDKAKRTTNPYELVPLYGTNSLHGENMSKNISPLSRAFFKCTEIYTSIDVIPEKYKKNSGNVANIAEGPGGFIEALYKQRTFENIYDQFYGLTLYSKNKNIPGWNQIFRRKSHFLYKNPFVSLKTGNLYNISHIKEYASLCKKCWLVTADGGFDYSCDFNNQEISSRKIIFAEITTAFLIQEKGGSFICKMFDLHTTFSIQLLYILRLVYDHVYITKPLTSRPANSEKYIVATGYKGIPTSLQDSMLQILHNWDELTMYYKDIIIQHSNVPNTFLQSIKRSNFIYTYIQKTFICRTLSYIRYKKNKYSYEEEQEEYAKKWFINHNIQKYNRYNGYNRHDSHNGYDRYGTHNRYSRYLKK